MSQEIHEHTLENGLLILLKENHIAPVICFCVAYRIGSKYERPGITGISHLLEHMMFKSSRNHPLGEFDKLLTLAGADNNAFTWLDETVYYEIIEREKVDIAIELEADRMRNLLFHPEEHKYEMTVVLNELQQRDDSPPTLLFESLANHAFQVHPYASPTIGWLKDVQAITVDDLKRYYDHYYQPDNAFIVAVGDFHHEEMLEKIKKYFGHIVPRGIRTPKIPAEPPQLGQRRFVIKKAGNNDYILIGFHIPESEQTDSYAITALSQILGSGRSSRLYRALVETQMTSYAFASASSFSYADPFLFLIGAGVNNGVDIAQVEKVIFEEVRKVQHEGVTEEELMRAKRQAKASFIYDRDSVATEARTIIAFELASSYKEIDNFLPRLNAVSLDDVKRVAKTYLTTENSTVGYFIGIRGESELVQAPQNRQVTSLANFAAGTKNLKDAPLDDKEPEASDKFYLADSHCQPLHRGRPLAWDSQYEEDICITKYENGLRLIVKESHNNETVALAGYVLAGAILDPPSRRGLAMLTGDTLIRGTQKHSGQEIAQMLENDGIELSFSTGRELLSISGRSISDSFPKLLELAMEILSEASFPEEEIEKSRAIILNEINRSEDDTFEKAYIFARNLLLGEDNPYGGRIAGSADGLASVKRDDIIHFYEEYYIPSSVVLVVVGDVETEKLLADVSELISRWDNKGSLEHDFSSYYLQSRKVKHTGQAMHLLNMPDKENVSIILMRPGYSRLDPDYYEAMIANFILGGDFLSRLNARLRVKEGLTYGSFSFAQPGRGDSPWAISVQVDPQRTEKALHLAKEEWFTFWEGGITEEELNKAKSYLTGNFAVRLDSISAISSLLADISYFDLGYDFISRYKAIIEGVEIEGVNDVIKRKFSPENFVGVIAGTIPKGLKVD